MCIMSSLMMVLFFFLLSFTFTDSWRSLSDQVRNYYIALGVRVLSLRRDPRSMQELRPVRPQHGITNLNLKSVTSLAVAHSPVSNPPKSPEQSTAGLLGIHNSYMRDALFLRLHYQVSNMYGSSTCFPFLSL